MGKGNVVMFTTRIRIQVDSIDIPRPALHVEVIIKLPTDKFEEPPSCYMFRCN